MMILLRKSALLFLVGVAALAFGSGSASADIQTFWKTGICPDFGGAKPAIAAEVGHMQAVIDPDLSGGTGGPFCVLDSSPKVADLVAFKAGTVVNADVIASVGDVIDVGAAGDTWQCVVCQYEEKTISVPMLSLLGTVLLLGGLFTAALYELRKRQAT